MQNERKLKLLKSVSITVVTVLFLLVTVLVLQFVQFKILKTSEQQLQTQLNQLEEDIINYSSENEYLASDEFVEDYAREALGYGISGNTRFR